MATGKLPATRGAGRPKKAVKQWESSSKTVNNALPTTDKRVEKIEFEARPFLPVKIVGSPTEMHLLKRVRGLETENTALRNALSDHATRSCTPLLPDARASGIFCKLCHMTTAPTKTYLDLIRNLHRIGSWHHNSCLLYLPNVDEREEVLEVEIR